MFPKDPVETSRCRRTNEAMFDIQTRTQQTNHRIRDSDPSPTTYAEVVTQRSPNPHEVLLIKKKIRRQLVARTGHGTFVLSPAYVMLERSLHSVICQHGYHMGTAELKRLVRRANILDWTHEEMDVWFHWCLMTEEAYQRTRAAFEDMPLCKHSLSRTQFSESPTPAKDGIINAVHFFVQMRLVLRCTQQQIDDIIHKLRTALPGRELHHSASNNTQKIRQLLDDILFIVERDFLLHFIEYDDEYLSDLLAEMVPDDIVYPCLLRKLLDSVIILDGSKCWTGTIGLLKCFRFVPSVDHDTFQKVMAMYVSGLTQSETSRLFDFCSVVGVGDEPLLETRPFLNILREKIRIMVTSAYQGEEELTLSYLQNILAQALTRGPKTSNPFALVYIHTQIVELFLQYVEELYRGCADDEDHRLDDAAATENTCKSVHELDFIERTGGDLPVMLKFSELIRTQGVLPNIIPDSALELIWYYGESDYNTIMETLLGSFPNARLHGIVRIWKGLCRKYREQHVHTNYGAKVLQGEETENALDTLPLRFLTAQYRSPTSLGYPATMSTDFSAFLQVAYTITANELTDLTMHDNSIVGQDTLEKRNLPIHHTIFVLYWRCVSYSLHKDEDFWSCTQAAHPHIRLDPTL